MRGTLSRDMHRMNSPRKTVRQRPEWLIGLLIAIVVVALGALVLSSLGAGDTPTFTESLNRVLSE